MQTIQHILAFSTFFGFGLFLLLAIKSLTLIKYKK
jgi:hypothetical protein